MLKVMQSRIPVSFYFLPISTFIHMDVHVTHAQTERFVYYRFSFFNYEANHIQSAKKISTCASKHVQKYRSLDGALSAVRIYCSGYIVTTEHVGR